uniref:(northern house mosquito) hypothetical protein n=1 Tax=Culex pipiens TaxID=7175 RepID=A0A8D8JLR9_CULPI
MTRAGVEPVTGTRCSGLSTLPRGTIWLRRLTMISRVRKSPAILVIRRAVIPSGWSRYRTRRILRRFSSWILRLLRGLKDWFRRTATCGCGICARILGYMPRPRRSILMKTNRSCPRSDVPPSKRTRKRFS